MICGDLRSGDSPEQLWWGHRVSPRSCLFLGALDFRISSHHCAHPHSPTASVYFSIKCVSTGWRGQSPHITHLLPSRAQGDTI